MAQVAYRAAGAGAEDNSVTTLAVPFPASVAADELLVLVLGAGAHSIGWQDPGTGWERHPDVPSDVNIGTVSTIGAECISVWYKWATGSESGNLTVTRTTGTDHIVGRMFAYNGFTATGGDPFVGGATNSGTDASIESPATAANATSNNDMGLLVCVRADDDSALGNWDEAAESVEWTETVAEAGFTAGNDAMITVNHCATVTSGNAIPANLETAGSSDPWWVLVCILKESASSGTPYTMSPAGTITPAGALVRADSKPLGGTITPAGALAKVATLLRSYAGTITPAGALVKAAAKSFAGTITPTGFLDNDYTPGGGGPASYFIDLAGTITPAGALAKVATLLRSYAGTITPAGALTKAGAKSFAGTITPAGALTNVRNYARSLAGTITPTGAYTRVVTWFRSFGGTITPSGTLERALNGVAVFFGFIDHVPTTDLTLVDHDADALVLTDHDENLLTMTDHTPTTS